MSDRHYPFENRREAGEKLAKRLARFASEHPVILALPRGGVPVAFEVAKALDAPLNLLFVPEAWWALIPLALYAFGWAMMVPVVTLLVTPEEADALSLADAAAKVRLILRNPLDAAQNILPRVTLAPLFQNGVAPRKRPTPPVAKK